MLLVAHLRCADDLTQMYVHPRITEHHVSIIGLSRLQLYQLQKYGACIRLSA